MSYDNVNWPDIKINGYPVDTSSEGYVEIVVVDDDVTMPASFAITFRSLGESDPIYKIGHIVEITPPGGMIEKPLVKGEITAITGDFDATGNRVHMRGYDISHRLHRGRKTRTFVNVTDTDIVKRVASAAAIDIGQIDQTSTTYDFVSQANQSDWDFLKSRAKAIGFVLYVDEGQLYFKKPTDSATAPGEGSLVAEDVEYKLVYGKDLIEWRPRLNSAEQVSQVEVRGWDRENKRELVSQAAATTTAAKLSDTTPASVAQPFGDATFVHAYHPGSSSDELDAAAKVVANHIGSGFAEAEGLSRGNGDLRPGTAVNISGVADMFSGRFVISRAKHTFSRYSYQTEFQINGSHQRTLLGLVAHAAPSGAPSNGKAGSDRIYGVVTAVVTGNEDPLQQGRVKVKFPWLSGQYESYWASVTQPSAGPNSGGIFIPQVDDEVLVAFENGDVMHPYVIGGLYNGKDKPLLGGDKLFDNGKVLRRGFVSRLGHQLIFYDSDQKSGIELVSENGKVSVLLDEKNRQVHVKGDMKVVVESMDEVSLTSKHVTVRADNDLTLRGGKVTIKADGVVDIDGSVIQLN